MRVKFVPMEIVLTIHADLLHRYGGQTGIRDRTLLESALAQPSMTFARKFLHRTIFDKAAAYGFHLCRNHPFIDGNKRVALVLMDIFLQMNGWEIVADEQGTYAMVHSVASGSASKIQLTSWLKKHSTRLPRR